jgi:hypothetical protein
MASSRNIGDIVSKVKAESKGKKAKSKKKTTTKKAIKTPKKISKPVKQKKAMQKTKKVKKDSKCNNKNLKLVVGIIVILVAIVAIYFSIFYTPYTYAFKLSGISYYSNDYTPTEFFEVLKTKEQVFVSPLMEDGKASPIFANVLNLWQVVLISNNIDAIQLIRTTDSSGDLKGCYTNFGDVTQSELISVEECNTILNSQDNFIIMPEEGSARALIEKNKLSVFAREEIASQVNFIVMLEIFPNAREALDIVNEKIYGLG